MLSKRTIIDKRSEKIKAKYKDQQLYQTLDEKSIRVWKHDPDLNDKLDFDSSHTQRRQFRKLVSPFLKAEEEIIKGNVLKIRC